jgi:hypothetical protein
MALLAAMLLGNYRDRFRGKCGHTELERPRPLVTHSVVLLASIDALQSAYSITSSAMASSVGEVSIPKRAAAPANKIRERIEGQSEMLLAIPGK